MQPKEMQQLISQEEYTLLMGAKPLTPELIPVAYAEGQKIMQWVIDENLEYRYINGACEDRAHYICLLLAKNGITCGKIWNFSPARFSNASDELFEIEDPYLITGSVTWGYHVAPYFQAYNELGKIETLVIDQSFCPKNLMTEKDWLERMKCPRAIQLHTDIHSYLFNSIYDFTGNFPDDFQTAYQTPLDLPSIITGNFWYLYEGDDFVQKGLAINDLAFEISEIKQRLTPEENSFLLEMVKNIDEVIKLTVLTRPIELLPGTFEYLRQFFTERYEHWSQRMELLLGNEPYFAEI